jgi:hypothetical protein
MARAVGRAPVGASSLSDGPPAPTSMRGRSCLYVHHSDFTAALRAVLVAHGIGRHLLLARHDAVPDFRLLP